MKVLFLLALIGFATASVYDAIEDTAEDAVVAFVSGLESAPSLNDYLEDDDVFYYMAEYDLKQEIADRFKQAVKAVVDRIRQLGEKAREVLENLRPKIRDAFKKLAELGLDTGDKAREILRNLLDEVSTALRQAVSGETYDIRDLLEDIVNNLSFSKLLGKLKDLFTGNVSLEGIIAGIKRVFGDGTELAKQLIQAAKNAGLAGVIAVINKIRGTDTYLSFQEIADQLKNLGQLTREKFEKVAAWLRDVLRAGIEKAGEHLEALKQLAKKVAERLLPELKNISREVALEIKEFLEPFAEEFGDVVGRLIQALKQKLGEL